MLRTYFCFSPIDTANTFDLNRSKYGCEYTWKCDTSSKWCHPFKCTFLFGIYIVHSGRSKNTFMQCTVYTISQKFAVIRCRHFHFDCHFFRFRILTIASMLLQFFFQAKVYILLSHRMNTHKKIEIKNKEMCSTKNTPTKICKWTEIKRIWKNSTQIMIR